MNAAMRSKAIELMGNLDDALSSGAGSRGTSQAQEAIAAATAVLGDDSASYKASDYALARAHAKISRLIGYHTLELSEPARAAWNALEDFVYGEARNDLRGVGGPNLG